MYTYVCVLKNVNLNVLMSLNNSKKYTKKVKEKAAANKNVR